MTDAADTAETRDPQPTRRRWRPWTWVIAGVAVVLITAVAIPLKVGYDCQRILNAAEAAGGELNRFTTSRSYPHVGYWPDWTKDWVKRNLSDGMCCLDWSQQQVFLFDESADIRDEWLIEQDYSVLPCFVCMRIRSPEVSDVGIRSLAGFDNLLALMVPQTLLTDDGLRAFAGHQNLSSVGLHRTHVTAAGLPVLATLPNLGFLDVSGTGITGEDLRQLSSCSQLVRLAVDLGQLSEPFLSTLSRFPKLHGLHIIGRHSVPSEPSVNDHDDQSQAILDDALLQRLLKETSITTLWINDASGVTDASVPALLKAKHVQRLNAWDAGITRDEVRKVNDVLRSGTGEPAIRLPGQSTRVRDRINNWKR